MDDKLARIQQKSIESQLREIRELEQVLQELSHKTENRENKGYETYATDAALRSERLTCKMRHLLYQCALIKKPAYLIKAAEQQGMAMREYIDIIEIELPCLLPKRSQKISSEFLIDPLYHMLEQYTGIHPIKRYESAVVCFIHEYDGRLSAKRIRDYDNIEEKQVLDAIAAFLLIDDSGLCCDTYHMTSVGTTDKTRILVMTRERFVSWIKENHG